MDGKLKQVRNFIKDKDKKTYSKILYECINSWINEKEFPIHYFTRLLYKKNNINYYDYMGMKKGNKIMKSNKLHNDAVVPILQNKLIFSNFLEDESSIEIPKTLGFNFKKNFYYNEYKNFNYIDNIEKIRLYIKKLIKDSPKDSIFIKPIDGIQGKDCFLVTKDNIDFILDNKVEKNILEGNFIFQETVIQHDEINKIYQNSVNTIRMDSYIDESGEVHLMSALMRFGVGGSFVDNISAGGFFVPIDIKKGVFKKNGLQLLKYGGNTYIEHPDTKFRFEGFEIPYFEETKEMVTEVAKVIPNRLVGWDIAISKLGPIIIEGNHNYSPRMSEMAFGGYKKHPIFKEILKKV